MMMMMASRARLLVAVVAVVAVVLVAVAPHAVVAVSPRERLARQLAAASAPALAFEHVCAHVFRVVNRSPSAQTFELAASAHVLTPTSRRDVDEPSATSQRVRRFVVPAATFVDDDDDDATPAVLVPSSIFAALEQRAARPIAVEFASGHVHRLSLPPDTVSASSSALESTCVGVSFRCRGVLEVVNMGIEYPLPLRVRVHNDSPTASDTNRTSDFVLAGANALPAARSRDDRARTLLRFDEAVYFAEHSDAFRFDVVLLADDSVSVASGASSGAAQPLVVLARDLRSPTRQRCGRSLGELQPPSDDVLRSLTCGVRALFSLTVDSEAFLARFAAELEPIAPAIADRDCDADDDGTLDDLIDLSPDDARCQADLVATTPQRACCAGNLLLDALLASDDDATNDAAPLVADVRVSAATQEVVVDTIESDVGMSYVALYKVPLQTLYDRVAAGTTTAFADARLGYRFLNCPLAPDGQTARGAPTSFDLPAGTASVSACTFASVDDTTPASCATYPSVVARWTFGSKKSEFSADVHALIAPYRTKHTLLGTTTWAATSEDADTVQFTGVAAPPHALHATGVGHTDFDLAKGSLLLWARTLTSDATPAGNELVLAERRLTDAPTDTAVTSDGGMLVTLDTDGAVVVRTYARDGTETLSRSTKSGLRDALWHHIVVTWDTTSTARNGNVGELRFFIDGLDVAVTSATAARVPNLAWASGSAWRLGHSGRAGLSSSIVAFTGHLEDVRLFAIAVIRTIAEVIVFNAPVASFPAADAAPTTLFQANELGDDTVGLTVVEPEPPAETEGLLALNTVPPTLFFTFVSNDGDAGEVNTLSQGSVANATSSSPSSTKRAAALQQHEKRAINGRRCARNSRGRCARANARGRNGARAPTEVVANADGSDAQGCGTGGCNGVVSVTVTRDSSSGSGTTSTSVAVGTRSRRRRKRQDSSIETEIDEVAYTEFVPDSSTRKRQTRTGSSAVAYTQGAAVFVAVLDNDDAALNAAPTDLFECGAGGCNGVTVEQTAVGSTGRRRNGRSRNVGATRGRRPRSAAKRQGTTTDTCPLGDDLAAIGETNTFRFRLFDNDGVRIGGIYEREDALFGQLASSREASGQFAFAFVDTLDCTAYVSRFDEDGVKLDEVPAFQGSYSGPPRNLGVVALRSQGFAVVAEFPVGSTSSNYQLVLSRITENGAHYTTADVVVAQCARASTISTYQDWVIVAWFDCSSGLPGSFTYQPFRMDTSIAPPKSVGACGNGRIDLGEECDPGTGNFDDTGADGCRSDCTVATCGDGIVDSNEACDDGDANFELDSACRFFDCQVRTCGDGVIDALEPFFNETCDFGRDNDPNNGLLAACRSDCTWCGDGIVDAAHGEQCDHGDRGSPFCPGCLLPGGSGAVPNGCAGVCGAPFSPDGNCWCDSVCEENNDCCSDFERECSDLPSDVEDLTVSSCAGFCGGSPDGECFCDPFCADAGDCCADFADLCSGTLPPTPANITSGSCLNSCSGSPDGSCFCDPQCLAFGDCCSDFVSVCGLPPPPTPMGLSNASCAGFCDAQPPGATCFCDGACFSQVPPDCCSDMSSECPHIQPGAPDSCEGVCGGPSPDGSCQCDAPECRDRGDCCLDTEFFCAEPPGSCLGECGNPMTGDLCSCDGPACFADDPPTCCPGIFHCLSTPPPPPTPFGR